MATIQNNLGWSILTSLLQVYTGSVIFIFLAKLMSISDFGVLTFGFSLSAIITIFFDFGLSLIVIKDYPSGKFDKNKYIFNVFFQKIIFVVPVSFVFFSYLLLYNGDKFKVGLLFIIYGILSSFVFFIQSLFRIKNKFKQQFNIALVYAFTISFLLLGYYYFSISLIQVVWFMILCKFLQFLYSVSLNMKVFRDINLFDWDINLYLLKNSWSYGLHSIVGILYFTIDTQLIAYFLSDNDVAIYQSIFRLIVVLLMASDIISNVFLPYLSSNLYRNKEYIIDLSNKFSIYLLILGCSLFLFLTSFDDQLIRILYSKSYLDSLIIILPLSIVIILRVLSSLYGNLLSISNNQINRLKTVLISLIFSIVFNVLFIPVYGIVGAAWISVLTHFLILIMYFNFSKYDFEKLRIFNNENIILLLITLSLYCLNLYSENIYSIIISILIWSGTIFYVMRCNQNFLFLKRILEDKGV